jgi:hypothetical protein
MYVDFHMEIISIIDLFKQVIVLGGKAEGRKVF